MKINDVLASLERIRIDGESDSNETSLRIIDVLVTYIGNQRIREVIDEICF